MLDQTILDNIIRRIVEVADPERIILFGSAARGDMNRHSDIDLLIVKEGADPLDLMRQIRRNLHRVGAAVDREVEERTHLDAHNKSIRSLNRTVFPHTRKLEDRGITKGKDIPQIDELAVHSETLAAPELQ